MLAEIITIGDELLIGQVVDTNSAWMARQLNSIGIRVKQISSVSDNSTHIISALDEAMQRADLILMTGGLGPTKDDITKHTLCRYFGTTLRFNERVFQHICDLFAPMKLPVTELNRQQAELPEACLPIYNKQGTAPGMWFEHNGKIIVSMPGVPYEMMSMMQDEILPALKKKFNLPVIVHKTVLTQGIGESFLAERIEKWEECFPAHIKLAYLPSPGIVRLRLSAYGTNREVLVKEIDELVEQLKNIIREFIYGYDEDTFEHILGKLLKERGQTLATAESCTGGYIAHRITSVPGSSAYFEGSVVAYSYRVKEALLGISSEIIDKYGAVSEQVVSAMAASVKKMFGADYSIACSGIAGPSGGTSDKPVGTVWIAVATPEKITTKLFHFGKSRERNIRRTCDAALSMLRKEMEAAGR